ncbi:hypothetical protein GALL_520970 [mine drainage metagenome]|uniref:Uncharacterized protein n=1 Tax=mine drainage metagenome TaxID=410659 RepID=A0A1J5PRY4_9ZZZZ
MKHREFPIQEVEVELDNPGHPLQLVADQALLGRAVHLVDAVAHPTGSFGCRIGLANPCQTVGLCRRSAAGIGRRVRVVIVVTGGSMVLRLDRQA